METTVTGDSYVLKLSAFVRANESILSGTKANNNNTQAGPSWLPSLTPNKKTPAIPPKPLLISLHHLSYLLLRFDALGLPVGKLDEPLPPVSSSSTNRRRSTFSYISTKDAIKSRPKSFALDAETASIGSVRSTLSRLSLTPSAVSTSWFSSARPPEPDSELKRLYSAFTTLPALELVPALETGLIEGFDDQIVPTTLTPLDTFRNLQSLTLTDIDPRSVTGWDRLSCQLKSLTINRGGLDDLEEVFVGNVAREARERSKGQAQGQPQDQGQSSNDQASNGACEDKLASSLPHLAWHFLQHLALPSTSLTFFADLPLRSLRSLDLSHNLLNAIPPSLASMPHLQSLDLTGNLIEDCRGAGQVLHSIRTLNLRSNRIEYLSGLEGCTTLKQIDLRENEIYEATEVGRLAQLYQLQKIWIKSNPVYEEYPDARVEIFLEFAKDNWPLDGEERNTIVLDNEMCGYFEKKRVIERLPLGVNLASSNESRDTRGGRIRSQQRRQEHDRSSIDSLLVRQRKERQTTPRAQEPPTSTAADEPTSTKVISTRRQKRVSTDKKDLGSSSPPPSAAAAPAARQRHTTAGGSERRRHRRIVNLEASNDNEQPSSSNSRSSSPKGAANGKRREEISEAERLKREVLGTSDVGPGNNANVNTKEQATCTGDADKASSLKHDAQLAGPTTDTTPPALKDHQPDGKGKTKADDEPPVPDAHKEASEPQTKPTKKSTSQDTDLSNNNIASKSTTRPISPASHDAQELRARIEGLKREVGDDWLRVLSRGN